MQIGPPPPPICTLVRSLSRLTTEIRSSRAVQRCARIPVNYSSRIAINARFRIFVCTHEMNVNRKESEGKCDGRRGRIGRRVGDTLVDRWSRTSKGNDESGGKR